MSFAANHTIKTLLSLVRIVVARVDQLKVGASPELDGKFPSSTKQVSGLSEIVHQSNKLNASCKVHT